MIKKRYLFIVSIAALLVSGFAASVAMLTFDGREPDDCTLELLGNSRKSVKNRIRRDAERYT
ncbi:MAG: hypothetical protein KDC45_05780, partial [Bacteroidetes bacterium]|nr:hypothetical protein [Bacteroidota bacterium]